MNLREWLAVDYRGPGRRRAAAALWLRDLGDELADGEPGLLRWRWRASSVLIKVYRTAPKWNWNAWKAGL